MREPVGTREPQASEHLLGQDRDELEFLAKRIAEHLLVPRAEPLITQAPLLTAVEAAHMLGVSASWVRDHADELGAKRLGEGPKPRLRFDLQLARDRLASRSASERSEERDCAPARTLRRARDQRSGSAVDLLPVRGRKPSPQADNNKENST